MKEVQAEADKIGIPNKIQLVDSTNVNAYCNEAGELFVTKGMIDHTKVTKSIIAFAVGHEYGHKVRGDVPRTIMIRNVFIEILKLITDTEIAKVASEAAYKFYVAMGRQQEYDSDDYAANLLKKHGYGKEACDIFTDIIPDMPGYKDDTSDDHPLSSKRYVRCLEVLNNDK